MLSSLVQRAFTRSGKLAMRNGKQGCNFTIKGSKGGTSKGVRKSHHLPNGRNVSARAGKDEALASASLVGETAVVNEEDDVKEKVEKEKEEKEEGAAVAAADVEPTITTENDPSSYLASMVGTTDPFYKTWDPVGLTKDMTETQLKLRREAEITHGRVGMLAALGIFVAEVAPLPSGLENVVTGPAVTHPGQTPYWFWAAFFVAVGRIEVWRFGRIAAVNEDREADKRIFEAQPQWLTRALRNNWNIRRDYVPGDVGFDPLKLRSDDDAKFRLAQERELNNGRLAMLASAGMLLAEAKTHRPVFGADGIPLWSFETWGLASPNGKSPWPWALVQGVAQSPTTLVTFGLLLVVVYGANQSSRKDGHGDDA